MFTEKTLNKLIVALVAAFVLYILFVAVSHAAPSRGTAGCVKTADFCVITASGGSADGKCDGGVSFSGASVSKYRKFDPAWKYRVRACLDGESGLKAVRIFEKAMRVK